MPGRNITRIKGPVDLSCQDAAALLGLFFLVRITEERISGSDLKRMRESVGIKQEEVYEITRISVSVLDAIENDHVENLPPPIYLKNFLKQYAEILQLDSERVVEGYTRHIAQSPDKI